MFPGNGQQAVQDSNPRGNIQNFLTKMKRKGVQADHGILAKLRKQRAEIQGS